MGISRMLKVQILGHSSVKERVKRFLREAGTVEVTEVSMPQHVAEFDEAALRELELLKEQADASIDFLDEYTEKEPFFERIARGPITVTGDRIEKLTGEVRIGDIWKRCSELQGVIRGNRDEIARSEELVRSLEPWRPLTVPLEALSTGGFTVELWTVPEKALAGVPGDLHEEAGMHVEEISRRDGFGHLAIILPPAGSERIADKLKAIGAFRTEFKNVTGTPDEIIAAQRKRRDALEGEIGEAEAEARERTADREALMILSDHFGERIGLGAVERNLLHTESTFLIEGWIDTLNRRHIERGLSERFDGIELFFRRPLEDEHPPIQLANRQLLRPFEFVTTLYGRPTYREVDPTPFLAPFFILFFAMCLTDAGYGLALSAAAAVILMKLKPSGGAGKLVKVLFAGGLVTAAVGLVTGGIFGIETEALPAFIRRFVFINPLQEPMTMLNIAFLMGIVHILFGMGIKMVSNFRAGLVWDAIFDDLLWILFIIALVPLGYSAILGGTIPPQLAAWSTRASLAIAAGIFLTGGRKQKHIIAKFFKGITGFYDVVGYFGDVLSYARLLALGLATSAIALAVNGIAKMVLGLPYYTGYVAALLVLVLGHGFNFAVNTLGAFVHSGRLQYLEFFSRFFAGGGKEFQPFRSERRFTVLEERNDRS